MLANQVLGRNDEVRALRFPSMFHKPMDTRGPDPANALFFIRNKCKTNTNGKCTDGLFLALLPSDVLCRERSHDMSLYCFPSIVEITGALEHKDAALCSPGHLALTLFERFVLQKACPSPHAISAVRCSRANFACGGDLVACGVGQLGRTPPNKRGTRGRAGLRWRPRGRRSSS